MKASKIEIEQIIATLEEIPHSKNDLLPKFPGRVTLPDRISDRDKNYQTWWRFLEAIHSFSDERVQNVLDIGSGEGTVSYILEKIGFEVHAIDFYKPAFMSKDNFTKLDLNQEILPYSDNTFDSIVCLEVIEHVESPLNLIKEISRILKPNGFSVISTPNIHNLRSRINFLLNGFHEKFVWINDGKGGFEPIQRVGGHVSPIDFYCLNWMLKNNDMKVEKLMTNIFIEPKSILKRMFFKLIKLAVSDKNNIYADNKLSLGDSLIAKVRKVL